MKKILFILPALFSISFSQAQVPTLWGVTSTGGDSAAGELYKINGDGTGWTALHSFCPSAGSNPCGTLIYAGNGLLYGTTSEGGNYGKGGLFSFDPISNAFATVLYFDSINGYSPCNRILRASDGKLYGIMFQGGIYNLGVMYSFDPLSNVYQKVFDFNDTSGAIIKPPYTGLPDIGVDLIESNDGNIYGSTPHGGLNSSGTLFKYRISTGAFTKLYDFDAVGGANGQVPMGNLIQLTNGNLLGITSLGGNYGYGTIFTFDITNNQFAKALDVNDTNSMNPAGLTLGPNGLIYGTYQLGVSGGGYIFKFNVNQNTMTKVYNFDFNSGGYAPNQALILASDNNIYGTTHWGATNGAVFRFDPIGEIYTMLYDFPCAHLTGALPSAGLMELSPAANNIELNPKNQVQISAYPNPCTTHIIVQSSAELGAIHIYDTMGNVVFEMNSRNMKEQVDMSKLVPGIYLVKVKEGCTKIIKE